MAVLIFGVATAPIFSNGMVFAQTEREAEIEKKQATTAKKESSKEKKQVSNDKRTVAEKIQEKRRIALEEKRDAEQEKRTPQEKRDAEKKKHDVQQKKRAQQEKHDAQQKKHDVGKKKHATPQEKRAQQEKRDAEQKKHDAQQKKRDAEQKKRDAEHKRAVAQDIRDQRHAELQKKSRLLQEKLDEAERIDREKMQKRIDAMKSRGPMTEAIHRLNQANAQCGSGTTFDPKTKSCVLDVVYSNDASTHTIINTTPKPPIHKPTPESYPIPEQVIDKTGIYFDKLRHTISEQKRTQDNLFRQITMLLNLVDSMCEDKVLVVGVSDGNLRCIDSDKAFSMHGRGLVTLVK